MRRLAILLLLCTSCQSYRIKHINKDAKIAVVFEQNYKTLFGQQRLLSQAIKQQFLNQYSIRLLDKSHADKIVYLKLVSQPSEAIALISQDNLDSVNDELDESYRTTLFKHSLVVKCQILDKTGKIIKEKDYKANATFSEWVDLSEESKQALKLTVQRLAQKIVSDF